MPKTYDTLIIGGGAAAIIGSQLGTETKTEIVTKDDRKIILYIKQNGNVQTTVIKSDNVDQTIAALRTLIPSKEESVVQLETHNKETTPVISSADELKKFKELLDCGVISQEEFDAKKKQFLGVDVAPPPTEMASSNSNGRAHEGSFEFQVVDYFTFRGKGLYVSGNLLKGTICVNDVVEIRHPSGTTLSATVNTVVLNEQSVQTATVGEDVGFILEGITRADMDRNAIITKN